jgi:rhodanese-related sulfurtransferase
MDMHFDGIIFQSHASELARRLRFEHPPRVVLDVRRKAAFAAGHIPGSVRVQADKPGQGLPDGGAAGVEVFVVSDDPTDPRVREASLVLKRLGATRVVEIPGAVAEWKQLGLALEDASDRAA